MLVLMQDLTYSLHLMVGFIFIITILCKCTVDALYLNAKTGDATSRSSRSRCCNCYTYITDAWQHQQRTNDRNTPKKVDCDRQKSTDEKEQHGQVWIKLQFLKHDIKNIHITKCSRYVKIEFVDLRTPVKPPVDWLIYCFMAHQHRNKKWSRFVDKYNCV